MLFETEIKDRVRWVQSCKTKCLDHFIYIGENQLHYLLNEYMAHYHDKRPHQALDNVPLSGFSGNETATANLENLVCEQHLGGLLKHYRRAASSASATACSPIVRFHLGAPNPL